MCSFSAFIPRSSWQWASTGMSAGITGTPHAEQGVGLWSMVDAWQISLTCRYSLSRGFRGINATVLHRLLRLLGLHTTRFQCSPSENHLHGLLRLLCFLTTRFLSKLIARSYHKKSKPFSGKAPWLCGFILKGLDFIFVWITCKIQTFWFYTLFGAALGKSS